MKIDEPGVMQNEFLTDRLQLNLISTEDRFFIKELVNTKGWIEFIGQRNVHSEQDAIQYVKKITGTPNLYYWVAKIRNSGTPIGIISFIKRSYLENFDIGFAFLPDYQGAGYAYEAAEKVLSAIQKLPEYHLVLATTLMQNTSSINLLLKLGFHFQKEINADNVVLQVYGRNPVS